MNSVVCVCFFFCWCSLFLVGLVVVVLADLVVVSFFFSAKQSTTGSPYWDDGFRDRVVLAHLISLSNHFCDTFGNLPLKTGRLGSFGNPFCCITVD